MIIVCDVLDLKFFLVIIMCVLFVIELIRGKMECIVNMYLNLLYFLGILVKFFFGVIIRIGYILGV